MMRLLICTGAFALLSGAALADETTVIHHDEPDAVVVHRSVDTDVDKKVVVHHEDGCTDKTVKKSDDMGNSVVRSESNC